MPIRQTLSNPALGPALEFEWSDELDMVVGPVMTIPTTAFMRGQIAGGEAYNWQGLYDLSFQNTNVIL